MTVSEVSSPATHRVAGIVSRLATSIDRRWNEEMRREDRFAQIAADELAKSGLLTEITMEDVVDWTLQADDRPVQRYRKFGEPPINVHVGNGFYIECIAWLEGDTAVHEHAFSGAFGVLHGSSIHARYRFATQSVESRNYIRGTSELLDAEILTRGSIRPIHKGQALTHALYHLDSPTFSIVVRTDGDRTFDQHVLFHRHALVLVDLAEPEETLVRLVDALAKAAPELYARHLRQAVSSWSGFAAWRAVSAGLRHCPEIVRGTARDAQGELARRLEFLIPSAEQQLEMDAMTRLVRDAGDDELRTFFTVLMIVPSRALALALLAVKFSSEEPRHAAARLVEKYASKTYGVDFHGHLAAVVYGVLAGEPYSGDARTVSKAERVWEKLRTSFMLRSLVEPF